MDVHSQEEGFMYKYNRADYMNGKCNHHDYFSQFVTKGTLYLVSTLIGKRAILASEMYDFSDIQDIKWERGVLLIIDGLPALSAANGGKITLEDKIHVLKAAAYMIKRNPELAT